MYKAPKVDLEFICHHLNGNPAITPRRQQPRQTSKEHAEAVKQEVNKLKQVGATKEVFFFFFFNPKWLTNTIVVKKKSSKWRVCVDFTDLNKAYPKDSFPVLRIDQLINMTFSHPQMSFVDVFQGYHQIPLALPNQEKTAFLTPIENYHYRVMSLGLKNVRSTYQC